MGIAQILSGHGSGRLAHAGKKKQEQGYESLLLRSDSSRQADECFRITSAQRLLRCEYLIPLTECRNRPTVRFVKISIALWHQ